MKKHVIYDSEGVTYEDAKAYLLETHEPDEVDDAFIYDEMSWRAQQDFEDEKINLNKILDNDIIVIADLGLWNGRKSGYKVLNKSLSSILSCFCGDYIQVYYDGHNVRGNDTHHDGTNHYLFRQVKEGVNIENLLDKIYNGTATRNDINNYTISLKRYVKEIYGWK